MFSDQCRHISQNGDAGLEYQAFHQMVSKLWPMQNTVKCLTMQFGNFGIDDVNMRMLG